MAHAEISEEGGVLTVTLTRAEKLNAISEEMTAVLWEAVAAVRDREDLRVLVITGQGRYFSAGIDLNSPTGRGGDVSADAPAAGAIFRNRYRRHHLLYDEIEAVEKPVILAAQGPCLGAGLEMAVSCDFRLASSTAVFHLPEVGLGTVPGSGGASRTTRLVGPHWAKWLAMAGEEVDAEMARSIGLVHAVYPPEVFGDRVRQFAARLAELPREAMGLTKLAVDAAVTVDRGTAREIERLSNSAIIFSRDFQSRLAAFTSRKKED
jgi:enoyl-CoA hydratase